MQSKNFYSQKYLKIIFSIFYFLLFSQAYAAGGDSDNSKKNVTKSSSYFEAVKQIKNESYASAIKSLLIAEKSTKNWLCSRKRCVAKIANTIVNMKRIRKAFTSG